MSTPGTTGMTATAAEQALFGDALTCDELRPAAFLAGAAHAQAARQAGLRAEALLHALAVVEDSGRSEEPEHPADHALQRLEAKLDLLTALVASQCRGEDADPLLPLRWSACGASLTTPTAVVRGSAGQLRLQPADWLPTALLLPCSVLACEPVPATESTAQAGHDDARPSRLWLRFDPLSPSLTGALERHLFRVHRRAIAESRRPR